MVSIAQKIVLSVQGSIIAVLHIQYTLSDIAFSCFVSSQERVRDTLIHEMCHAAVWVIDGVRNGGHGPHWKAW